MNGHSPQVHNDGDARQPTILEAHRRLVRPSFEMRGPSPQLRLLAGAHVAALERLAKALQNLGGRSACLRRPRAVGLLALIFFAIPTPASASTRQIGNSLIQVRFEMPAGAGSYLGTRFDWSGMVRSLRVRGHEVYGPWFSRVDPSVHNNVQRTLPNGAGEVVTGIASSGQGPAEEFLTDDQALGFEAAAPGGLFLKIGVGVLRRPDAEPYDRYRAYEVVDGGRWTTKIDKSSVTFRQVLTNRATGYGYVYTKTMQIRDERPVLVISHVLRNTGTKPLTTSVYDHNFFATGRTTDPAFKIVAPWSIEAESIARHDLVRTAGKAFEVLRSFTPTDMVAVWLKGFDSTPRDYEFRVEDVHTGLGYSVRGDRPLSRMMVWSIWTNISVESFIDLRAEPGREERWSYTYTYAAPDGAAGLR